MADGNTGSVSCQEAPISLNATASLATKQGYAMKVSSGEIVICSSQGEHSIGPLLNTPAAAQRATVESRHGVITEGVAGTNGVTQGNEVTTDANGAWEDASSSDWVNGEALDTAASGEKFRMLTRAPYVKA